MGGNSKKSKNGLRIKEFSVHFVDSLRWFLIGTIFLCLYRLLHPALAAFPKKYHILHGAFKMRISAIIASTGYFIRKLLICIDFIEIILLLLFLFFHCQSPSCLFGLHLLYQKNLTLMKNVIGIKFSKHVYYKGCILIVLML